jgi:hypothetical protein
MKVLHQDRQRGSSPDDADQPANTGTVVQRAATAWLRRLRRQDTAFLQGFNSRCFVMNHLGNFFHNERINHGLSLGELARMVGYRNISKGSRRITRLEQQGDCTEDLLAALADAMSIDLQTVNTLIDQDRQEHLRAWEEWASEPVPMRLIARYIPAVYGTVPLPEEITTPTQAEVFACEYAKQNGRKVCLALSRRLSVWIDAQGQVYARTETTPDDLNLPFMRLKGSKDRFLMRFGN